VFPTSKDGNEDIVYAEMWPYTFHFNRYYQYFVRQLGMGCRFRLLYEAGSVCC
jgi:hypothetical protein